MSLQGEHGCHRLASQVSTSEQAFLKWMAEGLPAEAASAYGVSQPLSPRSVARINAGDAVAHFVFGSGAEKSRPRWFLAWSGQTPVRSLWVDRVISRVIRLRLVVSPA